MSNRLTIEIYGTRYSITTTEDTKYVQSLARELDKMLSGLMNQNGISLNQAFMLMCMHYLDAIKKSEEGADHLRGQVSEYLKDAASARAELAAALQKLEQFTEKPAEKSGKKR